MNGTPACSCKSEAVCIKASLAWHSLAWGCVEAPEMKQSMVSPWTPFLIQAMWSGTALKLGGEVLVNQTADSFPECQGKIVSKVFGSGNCASLSGERSTEAIAKCKDSYDIDSAGYHWQCDVDLTGSGSRCTHSHLCQVDTDPLKAWDKLAPVSVDEKATLTHIEIPDTSLYSVGQPSGMGRLTDTKFVACGALDRHEKWHCHAVEDVVGGLLVGDRIQLTQYGVADPFMSEFAQNKAVFCYRSGSQTRCRLITAEQRVLKVGEDLVAPASLSSPFVPTLVKLEEGKLLLCMNNRIEWAKNHALMCGVLTENSGSLELGPLTELDSGMTYAYTNAKMSMVAPGKVLECHRRGNDKQTMCSFLTVTGTSITKGDATAIKLKTDDTGYVTGMTSGEAMWCSPRNLKCVLLDVSGSAPKELSELDVPRTGAHNWHWASLARLWSDRVQYCWSISRTIEMGNPYCVTITCKDKKCTHGEKSHPNGSDKEDYPRSHTVEAITLSPGKVAVCAEDRDNTGYAVNGDFNRVNPTCGVYSLKH